MEFDVSEWSCRDASCPPDEPVLGRFGILVAFSPRNDTIIISLDVRKDALSRLVRQDKMNSSLPPQRHQPEKMSPVSGPAIPH